VSALGALAREDAAAAAPALRESREQIGRLARALRAPEELPAGHTQVRPLLAFERGLRGHPQCLGHDPQLGRGQDEPLALGTQPLGARAPAIDPLHLVPHELATVDAPAEHLADRGRRPAARVPARRAQPLSRERLGDAHQPLPVGAELEDPAYHGRLRLVDATDDMVAARLAVRAGRREHLDVVVAVDEAAGDLTALGLAPDRVVGPLARLLPLHLGREVREREHHLVHRRVERALAILEVEEHAHAAVMICLSA
jgi:hypothetical protein